MSETIVEITNISKTYPLYENSRHRIQEILFPWKKYHRLHSALREITLNIKKGEHLGIIGKNGSGKSTLLKIIAGVLTPSSGTVQVNGTVSALLELGAGFNSELTGRENIQFSAALMGLKGQELTENLAKIIEFADIGEYIDQPIKTYSSGMFVRLAFAQSIISNPDLLIVDEALSVGDVFFQQKCIRRMEAYRKNGTVIFVSHDMVTMANICDKVLWIENGIVKDYGLASSVCERYLGSLYSPAPLYKNDLIQKEEIEISLNSGSLDIVDTLKNFESVGSKRGSLLNASIESKHGTFFSGGEEVFLNVAFKTDHPSPSVIIGFIVKNRIGQYIFGSNTEDEGLRIKCEDTNVYQVSFKFRMPKLLSGDYTVLLSLAEGTCASHTQLHLIYDALTFSVSRIQDRDVMFYQEIEKVEIKQLGN